ncbi:hypothetical protein QF031_001611 [Pseudarthrobacter defluvii]|uniref:hypothetical protein n=1 Tax=Pseudarthrobacter defluvii TaxID=410837 RepID=UPI00277E6B61|nr:hypothetical protein [Pseudarthrobacter defluvii]MDQ0768862.1 hypothetical protein [Pseudarthrobacter defluvii]
MSQEQQPIRSRRELRKAREAEQATPPSTEQRPPAAGRPADRAPAPAIRAQPAPDQPSTQRSSQIRARDRAALRTIKELEEKEGQLSAGGPPTRRQLRLQQLKEQTLTAVNPVVPPAAVPAPGAPSDAGKGSGAAVAKPEASKQPSGSTPDGMTVEQALEARALIAAQARNQIAKMEHIASTDPEAVDPEILAEQIALAERAAVLNRRAMARQKLAEQAGSPAVQPRPSAPADNPATADKPGPSTANNLAMVTPLEFVQVPGVDRPVMKPPATSHVPLTTRPGTKVSPGSNVGPGGKRKPVRPKAPAADSATGRSQVIARAEAAANAAGRPNPPRPESRPEPQSEDFVNDLPRVPARSAYGLDPLDAATAGLTRARRNRILQFCILAFGILALVAGIILIVSGMSR